MQKRQLQEVASHKAKRTLGRCKLIGRYFSGISSMPSGGKREIRCSICSSFPDEKVERGTPYDANGGSSNRADSGICAEYLFSEMFILCDLNR